MKVYNFLLQLLKFKRRKFRLFSKKMIKFIW
jgi:hypothetical protein